MATTRYVYFGNQYIGESDGNNVAKQRYVNEPDAYTHLLGQHDVAANEDRYYHFDAIGSTRQVTDESETVTDEITYDSWGNVLARTGMNLVPFQYVGERGYYREEIANQYYVMERNYNPYSTRWLSNDSITLGYYVYSYNDPANTVDYSGWSPNIEFPQLQSYRSRSDNREMPKDDDGKFSVSTTDKCSGEGKGSPCCTTFNIAFRPSPAHARIYQAIVLRPWVRTEYQYEGCLRSGYDSGWKPDDPDNKKGERSPWNPRLRVPATWGDEPGVTPSSPSNLCCPTCRIVFVRQSFEVCAIGTRKGILNQKEVIGCVRYGHSCNFQYNEYKIGTCCTGCVITTTEFVWIPSERVLFPPRHSPVYEK